MYALALDIGASWIKAAIGSEERIIARVRSPTYKGEDTKAFTDQILKTIKDLPDELLKSVVSIGIGTIGPLDLNKGILYPPNVKAKGIPLVKNLLENLDFTIYLANDCVAAVIGEWFFGKGRGFENLVYITISTGIGAGVIVDGRPILGKDGNAHEVGHLVLDKDSKVLCGCGGYGHWEALASGAGIYNTVLEVFKEYRGERTPLWGRVNRGERVSAREIYEANKLGDNLAKEIVERCNEIHAAGIASVINSYDPERLILGGSIVLNNPEILLSIKEKMKKYVTNRVPEIFLTDFGEDVVLMGALALIFKDFYGKEKLKKERKDFI